LWHFVNSDWCRKDKDCRTATAGWHSRHSTERKQRKRL
jgi:hypothetical protein